MVPPRPSLHRDVWPSLSAGHSSHSLPTLLPAHLLPLERYLSRISSSRIIDPSSFAPLDPGRSIPGPGRLGRSAFHPSSHPHRFAHSHCIITTGIASSRIVSGPRHVVITLYNSHSPPPRYRRRGLDQTRTNRIISVPPPPDALHLPPSPLCAYAYTNAERVLELAAAEIPSGMHG